MSRTLEKLQICMVLEKSAETYARSVQHDVAPNPTAVFSTEILGLVFQFAVEDDHETIVKYGSRGGPRLPGALTLVAVSQYWRSIVLQYSRLWSFIHLEFSTAERKGTFYAQSCLSRLGLFLERSQNHTLSVKTNQLPFSLSCERDRLYREHAQAFLQLLHVNAHRWGNLLIHTDGAWLPWSFLVVQAPRLKKLNMTASLLADESNFVSWSQASSCVAPQLEELTLSGVVVADSIPFLKGLKAFTGKVGPIDEEVMYSKQFRAFINTMQGLEQLHIAWQIDGSDAGPASEREPIHLPYLQTVEISNPDFSTWPLLKYSALTSVTLKDVDRLGNHATNFVKACPLIESLTLSFEEFDASDWPHFSDMLIACKNLTSLRITCDIDNEEDSFRLLDILTVPQLGIAGSETDNTFVCPNLVALHLDIWDFSPQDLFPLILARGSKASASNKRLRSLAFGPCWDISCNSQDVFEMTNVLNAGGAQDGRLTIVR